MSKNEEALKYYLQAVEINKEIDDKAGMVRSFGNIGNIYIEYGNSPVAIEYFQKSLNIANQLDNPNFVASLYSNIGNINFFQANYKNVLLNNSVVIMRRSLPAFRNVNLQFTSPSNPFFQRTSASPTIREARHSLCAWTIV